MTKYVLLISLIVAGAGVATAGKGGSGGGGGSTSGGCRHACSLHYNACIATCPVDINGNLDQACALNCVDAYRFCAGGC